MVPRAHSLPTTSDGALRELEDAGGDVLALRKLAIAGKLGPLQDELKALRFPKLGDRVRIVAALKARSCSEEPSPTAPAAPSAATGASMLVAHGAVSDLCDDGGLLKTTLRKGDAEGGSPQLLFKAKIRYDAAVLPDCRRFEGRVREFILGESEVPRGLDKAVATMHRGETAEVICRAEYAFGDEGLPPHVPGGASIRYEVELISWVAPRKERWELSTEEVFDEAAGQKAAGTKLYCSGLWQQAQACYHDATRLLRDEYNGGRFSAQWFGEAC